MKKGLLLTTLLVAILAVPYVASAYNPPNIWSPGILNGPLVSCTGTGNPASTLPNGTQVPALPPCQSLCDLIATVVNVVYFAIGLVLWIIGPVLLVVSGIMFLVAGANPEMLSRAKKTATGVVIGIAIVLCSWLIINTFVTILGITGIGGFGTGVCVG